MVGSVSQCRETGLEVAKDLVRISAAVPSYVRVRELRKFARVRNRSSGRARTPDRCSSGQLLGVSMATVIRGSAGNSPAPLVPRSGDEKGLQAHSSKVVDQAKLELSARYGLPPDEALEMLCASARSQRCSVEEFADTVVRSGGRLDGDPRGDSSGRTVSSQNGSENETLPPELLIDAPSAASAFLLVGSLADYGAHAVVERDVLEGGRRSLRLLLGGDGRSALAHESVARSTRSRDGLGDPERNFLPSRRVGGWGQPKA